MATAKETYTWADYGELLKAYLGVTDSSEDVNLEDWLASAAEDCDDYTGNLFVDSDGVDITHPVKIKTGVFEWVRVFRQWYRDNKTAGATMVKTGPLQENYGPREAVEAAREIAYVLWDASVCKVWMKGTRGR
jgi:hypothetical protein